MEVHVYATNEAAQKGAPAKLKSALVALKDNASRSKKITVISAFYGVDFVKEIFIERMPNKQTRSITLIFAATSMGTLQDQIAEMKELRQELIKTGYVKKRVDIRLATLVTFLHTKLFAFEANSGHKRYMVGSSNFSSAAFRRNDELLVLQKAKHLGLEAYISHALRYSQSIDDIKPQIDSKINNWMTFFREGFLYFKPSRQIPYTVNCFAGKEFSEIAKRLENATAGPRLAFHDAAGIGSLNLALLMNDNPVEIAGHGPKRVRIAAFSTETAFGYWVPSAYRDQVDKRIADAAHRRREQLKAQGDRLREKFDLVVDQQTMIYLDAVDRRLGGKVLSRQQRRKIGDHIKTKLKRLIQDLTEDRSLDRLSRPLLGAPVPEIWEDKNSSDALFDTFAEYVAYKLPGQGRSIISHLKTRFNLGPDDDSQTVRKKMEDFFKRGNAWRLNDWPLAADAVDDEED